MNGKYTTGSFAEAGQPPSAFLSDGLGSTGGAPEHATQRSYRPGCISRPSLTRSAQCAAAAIVSLWIALAVACSGPANESPVTNTPAKESDSITPHSHNQATVTPDATVRALAATVEALARAIPATPIPAVGANRTALVPGSTPAIGGVLSPILSPATIVSSPDSTGSAPYLLFNQRWVEGVTSKAIDFDNVEAVFSHIFSRLPDQVTVYPTENYYYFILYTNGRQVWGNFRLAVEARDKGILSFAYFEFTDFPGESISGFTRFKFFTAADGLGIEKKDHFTYVLSYKGKAVTFNLNRISQKPPKLFPLGKDETFVERTFDESGHQFFLLFNEKSNYFFWVLNEEEIVPDILESVAADLLVGKLSGFAFWVDKAHGNRKVLASVSRSHAGRNDYFDGPFDQLADNYAEEVGIAQYIERAYPYTKGFIDKYGNLTQLENQRVGITAYYVHLNRSQLLEFIGEVRRAEDPYHVISDSRQRLLKPPVPPPTTPR